MGSDGLDCAHTAGADYKGKILGTWGDIGCYSFEEKKLMTTGDGGMMVTNDPELFKDVKAMRPGLPVLILSIHPEEQYAKKARESGAAGYLTKYKAGDEVADAIRTVASGGEYFSRSNLE